MSKQQEALRLALEALEADPLEMVADVDGHMVFLKDQAITTIKEALANEALEKMAENARELGLDYGPEQEPVAWRAKNFYENQEGWFYAEWHQDGLTPQVAELLYTTPPQRTWVGLTDEEIKLQWSEFWEAECHPWAIDFAKAIEAKIKEKNNG